jgi:hypothetical protein
MSLLHFFSAPIGTYGNAVVNWTGQPEKDLITYAATYRSAAMNLVAFREQRGFGSIDHAALPILFLYRHSFELYLKSIVFRAAVLTINERELGSALPKLWREHSLVALFEMAKPVLKASEARPLTVTGELEQRIGSLACEIDDVDSGSYSFRYPVTSRGRSALNGTFFTNIFVFSERVEWELPKRSQGYRSWYINRTRFPGRVMFSKS